jgi:hypothetical protein
MNCLIVSGDSSGLTVVMVGIAVPVAVALSSTML